MNGIVGEKEFEARKVKELAEAPLDIAHNLHVISVKLDNLDHTLRKCLERIATALEEIAGPDGINVTNIGE